MKLKLIICKNKEIQEVTVDKFPAVFGRAGEGNYNLSDSSVSRAHFKIEHEHDNFFIQDTESTNGTYLNGKEIIERAVLKDWDTVEAGNYNIKVVISSEPIKISKVKSSISCNCKEISQTHITDATKSKLYRSHRALKIIYVVMDECNDVTDRDKLLDRLLESLSQTIGADRGMLILKPDETQTRVKSILGKFGKEAQTPIPEDILQNVINSSQPIISHVPHRLPSISEIVSLISAPLVSYERVFGALYLDRIQPNAPWFIDEDMELLTVIGMQIGGTLEKLFALEELTRVNAELQDSNQRLTIALEQLQKTQQHVIQQERLRAVGEMASGIAHDFNNVLAAISGYSELLLMRPENLDNKPKLTRYLELISTATQDGSNVVSRLRQFYRHREEDDKFTECNLNDIANQTVLLTQPRWKNQAQANNIMVEIQTQLQEGLPIITGNETELRQALTNLIFNAVDAMPQGGVLKIRTFVHDRQVALEVSDTGIGMSEKTRQRCLEPFFTTKKERGTGLGLSMAYGTVHRHGGTIDIQSEEGKGSTFTLWFPIPSEKLTKTTDQLKVQENPLSYSVLVVEDDEQIREIVVEYLTGDGHKVQWAANGEEGLQKFQTDKFDIVITDRAMPKLNGDQMAISIKRLSPNKPIIMLTGFGDMMQCSHEKPPCIDWIVNKPVTLNQMREVLLKAMVPDVNA